jgi:hypothetical protein
VNFVRGAGFGLVTVGLGLQSWHAVCFIVGAALIDNARGEW